MPRKIFSPEQIIAKLRQIEVLIGQGQPVAQGYLLIPHDTI